MKKKVWIIAIVIIALLGFGGYYLVNKTFNLILVSQLGDDTEPADMEKSDEDVEEDITEEVPEAAEGANDMKQADIDNAEDRPGISQNPQEGHNSAPEGNPAEKPSPETQKTEKKKVPTSGSKSITPEKIKEAEKRVSFQDKAKATSIVFSRLKPEDIALLQKLAKGGVSGAEMGRAKQILKARITKEETEVLKKLFYKYDHLLEEDEKS